MRGIIERVIRWAVRRYMKGWHLHRDPKRAAKVEEEFSGSKSTVEFDEEGRVKVVEGGNE